MGVTEGTAVGDTDAPVEMLAVTDGRGVEEGVGDTPVQYPYAG